MSPEVHEVRELLSEDEERIKKTRRRIEDHLRKCKDSNLILSIAKLLEVDDTSLDVKKKKKCYMT